MSALSSNTLRTEHVSGPVEPVESRPDLASVRRLQHVRGFPAVSVLASTSPADRLTSSDAATLDRLVARAVDRLRAEAPDAAAGLSHRLRSIALLAAAAPTDRALALYVHATHAEIVRLPMPVRNRVVVAETFAAGDLVMAFRHTPHYLLLLLGAATTRLFDGYGRRLEERNAENFRAVNPWRGATDLRAVGWDVDASAAWANRQRSYLRRVDAAIDDIAPYDTVPIVLAGDPLLTAAFLDITTRPERVLGAVPCDDVHTGVDAIGRLAGKLIERHALRLEKESLAALAAADEDGRVATGVAEVWPAVIRGQGQTLLVDESTTLPARISGDGLGLRPARYEGGRGIVADVIGELAWAATFYGGEVIVLPSGVLKAIDGLAAIIRSESNDAGTLQLDGLPTPGMPGRAGLPK
jgi:hypothetical protein